MSCQSNEGKKSHLEGKGCATKSDEFSGKLQTAFDPLPVISSDRDHSEGQGMGVNGHLEPFQKFITFGTLTRPIDWYDY